MASNQGNNQGSSKGSRQGETQGNKQSSTRNRGFASMDPQRQREIASEGGRAAHAKGTAHEFTSEEARRAGAMSHKNGNRQSAARAASQEGSQDNQASPSDSRTDNRQG
ncbi:stress-induced acidophilic repeat protein [Pseudoduganella lurida]|uniref:Stress-induced acidophilic repeat protein n=1 Tax=Pseudoduganella lurida TaxID=1036180 RepID=A0A562R1E2_9BURK|nr:KGG domain-containing protein [Pseudoduganella lurida]TWI62196.1 stress-induced acidophilic repeat protein [Pseudoduganella lurida]